MFYVIFHQETDPKVKKLFYEIIYCKCGAKKSPVLQGLMKTLFEYENKNNDRNFNLLKQQEPKYCTKFHFLSKF